MGGCSKSPAPNRSLRSSSEQFPPKAPHPIPTFRGPGPRVPINLRVLRSLAPTSWAVSRQECGQTTLRLFPVAEFSQLGDGGKYLHIYIHAYMYIYIYTYIYIYIHYIYIIHTYAIPLVYFAMQIHRLLYLTLFYSACVCTYIYIHIITHIYSHAIWLLTGMSTCVYSPYHMIAVHNSRGLEKPIQIHDIILHLIIYIHDYVKICMYCILWRLRTMNIKWYQFTSCFGAHQENKAWPIAFCILYTLQTYRIFRTCA